MRTGLLDALQNTVSISSEKYQGRTAFQYYAKLNNHSIRRHSVDAEKWIV